MVKAPNKIYKNIEKIKLVMLWIYFQQYQIGQAS